MVNIVIVVNFFKNKKEENRLLFWTIIVLNQVKMFIVVNYISFDKEFYMNEEAESL